MERLSDRAIEIINELHTERLDYASEYLPLIDCANKCSAYEDTGMEPCDYSAVAHALEKADQAKSDLTEMVSFVGGIGLDRLRELAQADKDGRCVVLPCREGDTAYRIVEDPFECNAEDAEDPFMPTAEIVEEPFHISSFYDFGLFLFPTRAEAEAALRAEKG